MKKLFLVLIGTLVYWYIGIFPSLARAQPLSLTISPPVVEILLAPNHKVSQTFTLQATGEELAFTPELHLVKPSDEFGHVAIDPSPLNPSSLPLIATISGPTSSPTVTLEAASSDRSQDVYLALVFQADSPSPYSIQNTAYSIPAISALILVTITPEGVLPINLEISNFDPPLYHDSWSSLTLSPSLQNNADFMIRPQAKFEVISPSGANLLSLPLFPNLILGNSTRLLVPHSSDLVPQISWSPTWKNIGPHRLRLSVTTEGGTKLSETEKIIWLLPLRLFILLLVLGTLALTIVFRANKLRSNA